jgi:hypothetical protein
MIAVIIAIMVFLLIFGVIALGGVYVFMKRDSLFGRSGNSNTGNSGGGTGNGGNGGGNGGGGNSGNGGGNGGNGGTGTSTLVMPTLYKDPGSSFAGPSWTPPGLGQHTIPVDSPVRNEASAIKVPAGVKITVCDKDDCSTDGAGCKTYTSNVYDLAGSGLNNDIACVIVAQN